MSTELDELISRIEKLDINQQRILGELVEQLIDKKQQTTASATASQRVAGSTGTAGRPQRRPNHNFISRNGVPLAAGDKVEITTTRKVGRYGDLARVDKFNQKYVAITILSSGKGTQRASKYLNFVE